MADSVHIFFTLHSPALFIKSPFCSGQWLSISEVSPSSLHVVAVNLRSPPLHFTLWLSISEVSSSSLYILAVHLRSPLFASRCGHPLAKSPPLRFTLWPFIGAGTELRTSFSEVRSPVPEHKRDGLQRPLPEYEVGLPCRGHPQSMEKGLPLQNTTQNHGKNGQPSHLGPGRVRASA